MPTSTKPWKARCASKFRNAGQTGVCANRLYVQDGVYDRFAEKLQQAVSKLHIGDGLDNGVTIGPLIDEKAVAKVEEHIADAPEKGARVVCGGKAPANAAATSSSRPFWWTFRPTPKCRKKRRSAPSPRCSALKMKLM